MNKSIYIHKSNNVSVLLYHLVCTAKYKQIVFTEAVDLILREVCLELAKRYELIFLEIGTDRDHVRFLLQRSEEHKSELQSLMRISYAVFCLPNKIIKQTTQ